MSMLHGSIVSLKRCVSDHGPLGAWISEARYLILIEWKFDEMKNMYPIAKVTASRY